MEDLVLLAEKAFLLFAAAFLGEAANEFLVAPFVDLLRDKVPEPLRQQIMRLWSAGVGILLAFELSLDIFGLLGTQARTPAFGMAFTGILIGRGSNWVHEMLKKLSLQVQDHEINIERAKKMNKF